MKTQHLFAAVLALLFPVTASWGEEPEPEEAAIPRMDSARMEMEWNDLRSLLEELYAARSREFEKEEPAPPPPYDWTISEARYEASVEPGNSLRVRAEFDIEVLNDACWARIPILKNTVAPVSAALNGEAVSLSVNADGWLLLAIQKPGVYAFETTFYTDIAASEGVLTAQFPCARTPVTHMTLTVPVKDAQVAAPDALNIAVHPSADGLIADLAFRSTENVAVQWTLPAVLKMKEEEAARPPEPPRVASLAATLATITDGYLDCRTHLRFDVLHGKADSFTIAVPKGVNVLEAAGQGAAWTVTETGEEQAIEVKVNHAIEADYELVLHFEQSVDEEAPIIVVPEVRVEDMVRQTGFLGLAARSNVEVAPAEGIENLTRIDITELPEALRAMSANPLLLGYKYVGEHYLLPLEARRLQDVAVRVASIDRALLVTMITEEGMAVTRARYDVRNNIKQFLRVALPENAEVWSAEVGGKVVKPARDGENGAILVPLFKSVETGRVLDTFPVELVYMESAPKSPVLYGKHALNAPATDILANEIAWQVLVPETQRVFRTSGDLKPAREVPVGTRSTLNRGQTSVSQETIYRLREGIERFYIKDINNPAASAVAGEPRYQGQQLQESAPAETEIAGVLPVRIDLPTEGVSYLFRRLMAPEGKELHLTLHVYHARWALAGTRAVFLAGWAVALGAGWLALQHARGKRLRRGQILFAAVAMAAVLACRLALGQSPWTLLFWTLVLTCAALPAPWLYARAQAAIRVDKAAPAPQHEA